MTAESFKCYIEDALQVLGDVRLRRMFGGYGIYRGEIFFGILHQDRLYFKTNETSRVNYTAHGMQPFQPNAKQTLKNYYEVPPEIVDDPEALVAWAREAIPCQVVRRG